MHLVSFSNFYVARWFAQHPYGSIALLAGLVLGIVTLCASAVVNEQTILLAGEKARLAKTHVSTIPKVSQNDPAVSLPAFLGGDLVRNFNSIADDMRVPLDEVAYALDTTPTIPYRRYRITLSVSAGYTDIRKFIAVLSAELPYVSLDSMRCARTDAGAAALTCELAFSAFFSKASHG